tara:strand:+ start:596 stop:724 length:129 start_codon:yes stop_codon:yes gene_type:complete
MKIAGDLCVYTNHNTIMEVIENNLKEDDAGKLIAGKDSKSLM